ncbi:MAG: hypothetical protein MOGMAGMI_02383 [Candidatus Omnitrophica bacterium]|nr:hypothetical protein [Candidatus Omnitrophota bacterium]
MHRIDHATAAPGNLFTEGNPATATPATTVTDDWLNDVQGNICDVVETAGLALVKGDYTQLRQAIQAMLIASQKAVIINNATFEASVSNGEVVRWDSGNSRFDEAIADSTSNNRAVGIADVTNSKVYLYGECPIFSGLTPASRYYLDASTAGAITTAAPTDKVSVGIAKSATTLWVDIDPGQTTVAVPTVTKLTSGSGTYNTPANARQLIVRMVGGGGGGGGGGTTGSGYGGVGGDTSFNSVVAKGGDAGAPTGGSGGTGGVNGTGTASLRCGGNSGVNGFPAWSAGGSPAGGVGGGSVFAGSGGSGAAGRANTGAGGSGGPSSGVATGGGGGGGEYVELIINSPAASYSYAVGAGGSAGVAGTSGFVGGAGGSGVIVVTEIYY